MQTIRFIVDGNGNKKSVVTPFQQYRKMIEDLHDLAVAAERRDEPVVSFNKLKEKLIADGLL